MQLLHPTAFAHAKRAITAIGALATVIGSTTVTTVAAAPAKSIPVTATPQHVLRAHLHSAGYRMQHLAAAGGHNITGHLTAVSSGGSAIAASPEVSGAPPNSAPSLLESAAGNTQLHAIGTYGSDQDVLPPDPDVAVGPSSIIEATNSRIVAYDRTLHQSFSADLTNFTNQFPGYSVTDPRIEYDPISQRFFLSYLEFSGCSSYALIFASPSGSLSNAWNGVFVGDFVTNTTGDQPELGFSNNVVAVSMNLFDCGTGDTNFSQSQLSFVQKSDLISGNVTSSSFSIFVGGPFTVQPVQSLTSIGLQYVIFNGSDENDAHADVYPFTGTPDQNNVTQGALGQVPMTMTSIPSSASQAGTSVQVNTDDDRFLNAVWQNGTLWTAGNTGCTGAPSCLDYVKVIANSSGTVTGGTQLPFVSGGSGVALYYPAVSMDAGGDMFTVFNESSSSAPVSVVAAGVDSSAGGSGITNFTTLQASTTYYDPGTGSPARWGDFNGAAQDPLHPSDVWVVGEDVLGDTGTGCATANTCWDTVLGHYTFAGPTITSVTPGAGPIGGGQTVTVSGYDFLPGTTATLGGASVTPAALSPYSFQFTTPSHAAGLTYVQATDSLGSTPAASASAGYIYTALGDYTPVAPFRIYDSRPPYCVNCNIDGSGPLGPNGTRTVAVAGSVLPSANQVVPTSASAVVLNVTVTDTTGSSFLAVWPNGTGRPTASDLNFVAGKTIANLVTVVPGQSSVSDTSREIALFNLAGNADVVVDVEGYYATPGSNNAGTFHPLAPYRICDTRGVSSSVPNNVCNADSSTAHPLGATAWLKVNVSGPRPGGSGCDPTLYVPCDGTATGVVMNLTAVTPSTPTFLSVAPTNSAGNCPTGHPAFSNVNLSAGGIQPNRVAVPLGPVTSGGLATDVCVFNYSGSTNFILDLNGWYGSGSESPLGQEFQAIGPSRICDTRASYGTECQGHSLGTGGVDTVQVTGVAGVPSSSSITAVVANATGVAPSSNTFLTLYPSDVTRPNASDLNLAAGSVVPNLAVVKLAASGSAGSIDVYNLVGSIDVVIDVEGWFQ